nr:cold shock domain-containing protein [Caulobacter sp. UNC279MFTsu5.1]
MSASAPARLLEGGSPRTAGTLGRRQDSEVCRRRPDLASPRPEFPRLHVRKGRASAPNLVRAPATHFGAPTVRAAGEVVQQHQGFGFIQPDSSGGDIFVHISAVERAGLRGLAKRQAPKRKWPPEGGHSRSWVRGQDLNL